MKTLFKIRRARAAFYSLVAFLCLSSHTAKAAQYGDFTYTNTGSAIAITRYTGYGRVVTIPNTIEGLPVTTIGVGAFYVDVLDLSFMVDVTIPDGVTTIGIAAFANCENLTNINMPTNLTTIGDRAFEFCGRLATVIIPASVTNIGQAAFYSCFASLTTVTIPASVTCIGDGAFASSGVTEVLVEPDNASYISMDGVLFNKDRTIILQYPAGKPGNDYSIPDSVTVIGNYAFHGCFNLTNVAIPAKVTAIGDYAFVNCSLTTPTIPVSVISIGNSAFVYCRSMTKVTIPGSVTTVGTWAFAGCGALTSATVSASVATIGDYAFADCTNLRGVYFRGNAPAIGPSIFRAANKATI
jgi:hypothetical protein